MDASEVLCPKNSILSLRMGTWTLRCWGEGSTYPEEESVDDDALGEVGSDECEASKMSSSSALGNLRLNASSSPAMTVPVPSFILNRVGLGSSSGFWPGGGLLIETRRERARAAAAGADVADEVVAAPLATTRLADLTGTLGVSSRLTLPSDGVGYTTPVGAPVPEIERR